MALLVSDLAESVTHICESFTRGPGANRAVMLAVLLASPGQTTGRSLNRQH